MKMDRVVYWAYVVAAAITLTSAWVLFVTGTWTWASLGLDAVTGAIYTICAYSQHRAYRRNLLQQIRRRLGERVWWLDKDWPAGRPRP